MQRPFDKSSPAPWRLLVFLLLLTVIAAAYSNTLHAPFLFDDDANIVHNTHLKITSLAPEAVKHAAAKGPSGRRWLPNISFALNYYFGGLDVRGYHIVNLGIHLLCSLTVYLLAHATLTLPHIAARIRPTREIALTAALLWAAHPVQTNAVTYIVQRMTAMAALFSLASLLFYVYARLAAKPGARKYLLYGASVLCWLMALISKENSAILPITVLGYEFFFLRAPDGRGQKKFLAICATALIGVFLIGWFYLGGGNFIAKILAGYSVRDFTLTERLLTEARVLFHYLGLLALPLPSRLQLDYDYPVSTSLWSPPQTLAAITAIMALCLLAIYLYRKNRRLAGFAVFWYMANLVIESTVIPLELVYEHRLYLPSVFPVLALTAGLFHLAEKNRNRARMIAAVIVCILALLTWQRNATWNSKIDLWRDAAAKAPGRARVHVNLAMALKKEGDIETALHHLHKAIELEPEFGEAYLNLGVVYKDLNLFQNALVTLNTALTKKRVSKARIHYALGLVHGQMRHYAQAISHAEKALRLAPYMQEPLVVLGAAYDEMGQHEKACAMFEKARRRGHETVNLYINWALACKNMGKFDEALAMLDRVRALNLNNPKIHYLRGLIYQEMNRPAAAAREFTLYQKLKQPGRP